MKKIQRYYLFASLLICSCTSDSEISAIERDYANQRIKIPHSASSIKVRSEEHALADYTKGKAIIYLMGDFIAVPVGLEQREWGTVSHIKTKYLGPVLPKKTQDKAAAYNRAIYEQLSTNSIAPHKAQKR